MRSLARRAKVKWLRQLSQTIHMVRGSASLRRNQGLGCFFFFKSVAVESRGGQVSAKTSPAASHYTILLFKSAGSEENQILETDNLIQPAHQFSSTCNLMWNRRYPRPRKNPNSYPPICIIRLSVVWANVSFLRMTQQNKLGLWCELEGASQSLF